MGYDEALAARVRAVLGPEQGITERSMFGGLAFLADGRMAVAVSRRGVMMVRADDGTVEQLLGRSGVERTVMRGRPMRGWLDVDTTSLPDDDLPDVVGRAVAYARTCSPG